jgi:anti-sigma factor RsiW
MTHQEAVETMAAERYLLDEMSEDDRQTFEDHYFSCSECADDLRTAGAMLEGARSGFAAQTSRIRPFQAPSQANRRTWQRSVVLPWAAAATLAIVAGYQSLWVVPSLRKAAAPVALSPVTLRPESRGQEPVVHTNSTAPVSLAIDVEGASSGGEVTYDLSRADGTAIVSGRAPSPAAGMPLLLLMPAWTVTRPMHYILSIHAAGNGRLLGEYRFEVAPE